MRTRLLAQVGAIRVDGNQKIVGLRVAQLQKSLPQSVIAVEQIMGVLTRILHHLLRKGPGKEQGNIYIGNVWNKDSKFRDSPIPVTITSQNQSKFLSDFRQITFITSIMTTLNCYLTLQSVVWYCLLRVTPVNSCTRYCRLYLGIPKCLIARPVSNIFTQ